MYETCSCEPLHALYGHLLAVLVGSHLVKLLADIASNVLDTIVINGEGLLLSSITSIWNAIVVVLFFICYIAFSGTVFCHRMVMEFSRDTFSY